MTTITALILAGGRATRMGGEDKGLIQIAGKPMAQRIAEQLVPQVDHILINANRNLERYEALGHAVIEDQMTDYQGPLAGMLSGLRSMESDWLLTTPCDGPFVDAGYAAAMIRATNKGKLSLAVASDGERLQPVYCLIHHSLAASLEGFLESGDRKIDRWFAQHRYATVLFDREPSMFTNVNTPEELAELNSRW